MIAALLLCASVVTACGEDEPDAPMLVMPKLAGKVVGDAIGLTYADLHTSLVSYDLSPADRKTETDWVVVATEPAAGELTPMYTKVYAWVLKASEYRWFAENPTMPEIPAKADTAKLIGKNGLLEPVKDLVQLRYLAGRAPQAAGPSPVDEAAFTPDRGLYPDLATEPPSEFKARTGLLAAPRNGTVAVASRPMAESDLRVGQYLVVLVTTKPKAKPKPRPTPPATATRQPPRSSGSSGGGSSSGGGGSRIPGLPSGFPTKIPSCPKSICG